MHRGKAHLQQPPDPGETRPGPARLAAWGPVPWPGERPGSGPWCQSPGRWRPKLPRADVDAASGHWVRVLGPWEAPDTQFLYSLLQGPGRKRRQSSDSCSEEPDSTTPPAKSPRGAPGSGGHGPLRYRGGSSAEQSLMVGLRVDGGAQQCLDCGLCFASPGSLSRHRFISHKKKRGVGSASALGLGDGEEEAPPPSRSDPDGGESPLPASGGPLTCKVCGKSCDSPLNLKTHFRTHGMAFIRARQGGSGDN